MMAATVELVFVSGHAIMERHFAGQSAFRQQLQRAIDRREPDLCVFFAHQSEKLIGRKMVPGIKKRAQNGVSLLSVFQAHALQVLEEYLLGLAYVLSRWWRMVVNSLLQHLYDSPGQPAWIGK